MFDGPRHEEQGLFCSDASLRQRPGRSTRFRLAEQATLCFVASLLCCRLSSTTAAVTFQVLWKCRGRADRTMRTLCAHHTPEGGAVPTRSAPASLGVPGRRRRAASQSPLPLRLPVRSKSPRDPRGLRADDQPGLVRRSPHAARNSGMRIPGGDLRRRRLPGSLSETREGTQARRRRHSGDRRPELLRPPAGDAGQRAVLPQARAPRHQTATSSRMRKMDTARIRSRSG